MNQHDMTELVLTASDARDFPDYRQVLARVLLELDARMTTLEVVVNASAKNTGEGRAEEARSGSVTGPSKQPVQARPTGVREDVSVVDEGPVASRQAAPSPASPSPDEVEALARELQRVWEGAACPSDQTEWHDIGAGAQRGYLAEARYVLSRYEPRGARASASAVPMTHPASKTLNECREVFRRVAKRGPCLSSPDLHGIAAVRDFLTLSPEKFRENWGPRDEGDDEKCEGGEDPHGASAKNTGEGEVEHAASVSRSVSAKDASRATTPNNAEEGASAMRHGSGARPDATSLSTACPLCHGMLSEDECKKQNTPSPQGSTASAERSVRVDVVHANDGTPLMAAAHVAQPLTGGEGVPLQVAPAFGVKGDYVVWRGMSGIATFHGPDAKANAETFASRATAQPSVEEMAMEMLHALTGSSVYREQFALLPDDDTGWTLTRTHLRKMAKAALSAMPASEATKPAPDAPKPEEVARIDAIRAQVDPIFAPKPASEAQGEPSERIVKFLDALEKRLDVDDDDAWMLSRSDLDYLRACLSRAPSPSPALAAIVEKADAMASTMRLIRNRAPLHEDYQRDIDRDVAAYDRARAALPKDGADAQGGGG